MKRPLFVTLGAALLLAAASHLYARSGDAVQTAKAGTALQADASPEIRIEPARIEFSQ